MNSPCERAEEIPNALTADALETNALNAHLTSAGPTRTLPPALTKTEFPATCTAHWPTGPVPCCEFHAIALRRLAGFMGSHIAVTVSAPDGSECANCKNEAASAAALKAAQGDAR